MASCASFNSIPINFSALCIISLVMRGTGVGDGDGEGRGVGVGVCAAAGNERLDETSPAAPTAGSSFTNVRRSTPPASRLTLSLSGRFDPGCFLFIAPPNENSCGLNRWYNALRNHGVASTTNRTRTSILDLQNPGVAEFVDRHDKHVVKFVLRNDWKTAPAERSDNVRHCVVVTGYKNCLAAVGRENLVD